VDIFIQYHQKQKIIGNFKINNHCQGYIRENNFEWWKILLIALVPVVFISFVVIALKSGVREKLFPFRDKPVELYDEFERN